MLVILGVISLIVTIVLTIPPLAPLFGFAIPHARQVLTIIIILLLYAITADLLKIYFFRKHLALKQPRR